MKFSNNKILVTGGAGFIGSNLCEHLLKHGNKVVCLDNFSTGRMENIHGLINNRNFILLEGDIRDLNICERATKNVDYVLHQAALGSVPRSINDPITSNDVNVNGFLNMLVASRDSGIKRFVYASSSSTYGDSKALPKVENQIGNPLSPYAITKFVNELYADVFSKTYGLETIGLRYFNVFGKRQDPNGSYAAVIPKFISQLINGVAPTINGKGLHSRDFTYVENVIQANILSLATTNKKAINNVYNIAFGERTTLIDLFNSLKDELTKNQKDYILEPKYSEFREGDVRHSQADISKAKNMLSYEPSHSLLDGIGEIIPWYIKNFNR